MRYFLDISYRGTAYHGWQVQSNAVTVQGVLNQALNNVLGTPVETLGSGRTDTGVHAYTQIVQLDSDKPLDERFLFRMNACLPKDIYLKSIRRVKDDAHARFDALSRSYVYRITTEKNPFETGTAYYFYQPLNIEEMNKAAALLLQYEDFESFSKVHTAVSTFNCTIFHAYWEQQNSMVFFHIKANRFLRGMVRALVGTMLEIGKGRMTIDEFEHVIHSKDRRKAGAAAPPEALYLSEVLYPTDIYIS